MDSSYSLIPEVNLQMVGKKEPWTAKVTAVAKLPPKSTKATSSKYQNVLLLDSKGNTVQATLWNNLISAFANELIPGKTYLISNAYAKKNADYYVFGGDYIWTISFTTRVELVDEDCSSSLFSIFQFTDFHLLPEYMDKEISIGIIGIALEIYPKRLIYPQGVATFVQDVLLMNRSFETITLTLWDTYIETEGIPLGQIITKCPIVIGQNLKVTSFNGISVNTQKNAYFYFDPNFEEIRELKEWILQSRQKINECISNRAFLPITPLKKPKNEPLSTIKGVQQFAQVLTAQSKRHFWVKATAKILPRKSSFAYLACNICNTASSEPNLGEIFHCRSCTTPTAVTIARARADAELQDSTGTIQASMMGKVAEKFFQCSATEIITNTNQDKMRMEINEHTFYLKLLPTNASPSKFTTTATHHIAGSQVKFEIIFMIPPHTDESTAVNVDHMSSIEQPNCLLTASSLSTKRALFQDQLDSSGSAKKNCTKEKLE